MSEFVEVKVFEGEFGDKDRTVVNEVARNMDLEVRVIASEGAYYSVRLPDGRGGTRIITKKVSPGSAYLEVVRSFPLEETRRDFLRRYSTAKAERGFDEAGQ